MRHREAIESHLFDTAMDLFDAAPTVTLNLTNTYFEGGAADQPKARRGHSKEKRSDCPLLTLGLVLDGSGFVRRYRVFAGNVEESETLPGMLEALNAPPGARVVIGGHRARTATVTSSLRRRGGGASCSGATVEPRWRRGAALEAESASSMKALKGLSKPRHAKAHRPHLAASGGCGKKAAAPAKHYEVKVDLDETGPCRRRALHPTARRRHAGHPSRRVLGRGRCGARRIKRCSARVRTGRTTASRAAPRAICSLPSAYQFRSLTLERAERAQASWERRLGGRNLRGPCIKDRGRQAILDALGIPKAADGGTRKMIA